MGTLSVLTAASGRNLTTVAAVKAELGITDSSQDGIIASWIEEESAEIEAYCGRVFAGQQYRQIDHFDRQHGALQLDRWPLIEVTGITVAGSELSADDYEADLPPAHLFRLSGDRRTCWGYGRIVTDFWAGYRLPEGNAPTLPASAEPLPANIQRAVKELVKLRWASRKRDPMLKAEETEGIGRTEYWVGGTGDRSSGGLPPDVAARLDVYRAPCIV